jgi:hypothetical protein
MVPGRSAELELIRLHPLLGEALLAPTVSHATVLGIVPWHHERWDGCGYPGRGPGRDDPPAGAAPGGLNDQAGPSGSPVKPSERYAVPGALFD